MNGFAEIDIVGHVLANALQVWFDAFWGDQRESGWSDRWDSYFSLTVALTVTDERGSWRGSARSRHNVCGRIPLNRGFGCVRPSYRRGTGVQSDGDLTPRQPFLAKLLDLIAVEYKSGSADRSPAARPFLAGAVKAGACAFADSDALLLCDGCEDREHRLAEHTA
jgi:hypothetical protein